MREEDIFGKKSTREHEWDVCFNSKDENFLVWHACILTEQRRTYWRSPRKDTRREEKKAGSSKDSVGGKAEERRNVTVQLCLRACGKDNSANN